MIKGYSFLIGIITLISWIIVASLILKTDPNKLEFNNFILFFGSLFIGVAGLSTLIGNQIRISANKNVLSAYLITSLRQGLLISLAIVGLLLLQVANVLNWWDGILLVTAILLLEFYFRTK